MGLFRNIKGAISRLVAQKPAAEQSNVRKAEPKKHARPKRPAPEAQAAKWAENIRMHLEQLDAKGALRIRNHNSRPECDCMLPSMLDAYLLYVSLPDVVPEKVHAWCSADDLFYTYERLPQVSLTLTDRVLREDYDAVIRLTRAEEAMFTIFIKLENRQNVQTETIDADNQN